MSTGDVDLSPHRRILEVGEAAKAHSFLPGTLSTGTWPAEIALSPSRVGLAAYTSSCTQPRSGLFGTRLLETRRHQILNAEQPLNRRAASPDLDLSGAPLQIHLETRYLTFRNVQRPHRFG